jgi:hypothetical protein
MVLLREIAENMTKEINNFKTNTTIINTNFAPNNNINKVFLSQNPTQRG